LVYISVADPERLSYISRIQIFFHPKSLIPDLGFKNNKNYLLFLTGLGTDKDLSQMTKIFSIFKPKNGYLSSQKIWAENLSRTRIQGLKKQRYP